MLPISRLHQPLHFNSIKVRLEQRRRREKPLASPFQFHKGAIRTVDHLSNLHHYHYFNSIKVRLEHDKDGKFTGDYMRFQFHKGAIRTKGETDVQTRYRRFQFHKGAIRTLVKLLVLFLLSYFNSIKVRLEQARLF